MIQYRHPQLTMIYVLSTSSATPVWHMFIAVSALMYTTSYIGRDCK